MVRFLFNPFTEKLDISGTGPGGTNVQFVTGNDGVPVPSDAGFNINILGDNTTGINTTGNAGTSTITIHGLPSSTTQVGTTAYATNAQAAAQSATSVALTPSNIPSLFSSTSLPASQGGTGLSSPAANSLLVTNGASAFTLLGTATNGQLPIGSVGGPPVLANITPGAGITVTNGPGTITISASSGTIPWTLITASQTLAINNGYICSGGGALSLALPAVSPVGSVIEVSLSGSTSFTITQAAGQGIQIGSLSTTTGATGTLSSTSQGDSIRMVCKTANLSWIVLSSMGNLTTV